MRSEYIEPTFAEVLAYSLTPTNQLICRIMRETGMRVGDCVSLKVSNIRDRKIKYKERKTGKKRVVNISAELYNEIKKMLPKGNKKDVFLFPSVSRTGHRTRQAVYIGIKKAGKRFSVGRNFTPHSYRKIYAVERRGKLERLQKDLNHDNMGVTAIYAFSDIIR